MKCVCADGVNIGHETCKNDQGEYLIGGDGNQYSIYTSWKGIIYKKALLLTIHS